MKVETDASGAERNYVVGYVVGREKILDWNTRDVIVKGGAEAGAFGDQKGAKGVGSRERNKE